MLFFLFLSLLSLPLLFFAAPEGAGAGAKGGASFFSLPPGSCSSCGGRASPASSCFGSTLSVAAAAAALSASRSSRRSRGEGGRVAAKELRGGGCGESHGCVFCFCEGGVEVGGRGREREREQPLTIFLLGLFCYEFFHRSTRKRDVLSLPAPHGREKRPCSSRSGGTRRPRGRRGPHARG